MGGLDKSEISSLLEQIRHTDELEKLSGFIKQVDALKAALECVGTFRTQSVKYAQLEAETLIRIVTLGGLNNLRGWHKKTAEWLHSLSSEERTKYICFKIENRNYQNFFIKLGIL